MQYCSLEHWTLLPSPITSTTGCCFFFGSISLLFIELFLHSPPVAYWALTNLQREFIFQCPIFLPFYTVHGFLKARILKWFAIYFSSGWYFVRTLHMTRLSWGALHGMAHSFIELDKAVVHVISLVSDPPQNLSPDQNASSFHNRCFCGSQNILGFLEGGSSVYSLVGLFGVRQSIWLIPSPPINWLIYFTELTTSGSYSNLKSNDAFLLFLLVSLQLVKSLGSDIPKL